MKLPLLHLAAILTLGAAPAVAADSTGTAPANGAAAGAHNSHPPVVATRLMESVSIDGVLTEAVWKNGNAVTDFKQRDPDEGAHAAPADRGAAWPTTTTRSTSARAATTPRPTRCSSRLTRRDVSIPADRFSVYLDPYHDRRSGYYFLVNAAGTLFDGTLYNDGWEDARGTACGRRKAKVDDQGWTVRDADSRTRSSASRSATSTCGASTSAA